MKVGALEVLLTADLTQLKSQLATAANDVASSALRMESALGFAKTALIGLVGVASIGAFAGMIRGAIEANEKLHDLAASTGISVAALGQFRAVGAYTGTAIEDIAAASLKLSKNLATTDEEGRGAALAIKSLGLDFDDFRKLNPADRTLALAKAMNEFKDGADKSAAATLLWGKAGAAQLPYIKDLGMQADEITAKLTDQEIALRANQAAMADAFGDNLTAIRKQSEGWKKDLSMGLLPALWEASEAVLQMTGGTGGLKAQISALAKDGTFAEWARGAITVTTYFIDVVQGLWHGIKALTLGITGLVAGAVTAFGAIDEAIKALQAGNATAAWESLKTGFTGVKTIAVDTADQVSTQWNAKLIGQTFRDTMGSLKGISVAGQQAKKDLNLADVLAKQKAAQDEATEAAKRAEDAQKKAAAAYAQAVKAGDDLARTIDRKNAELEQELALGRALTPVEKELIKLSEDLTNGKISMTKATEAEVRAAIAHGAELEQSILVMKAIREERAKVIEGLQKHATDLAAQVLKQREENDALRLGKEGLELLEVARLNEQRRLLEQTVATEEYLGLCTAETEAHRETLKALNELIDAKEQGVHLRAAKEANEEWRKTAEDIGKGLTDSLFRAFESGKGFFQTLWDGIKNLFKTTVLKMTIQPVQNGINSFLGGIFGGGQQGAAGGQSQGGIMGSINSLSSAYSSLAGLYTSSGLGAYGTAAYSYLTTGAATGTTATNAALIESAAGSAGYGGSSASAAGSAGGSMAMAGWIALAVATYVKANQDFDQGYGNRSAIDAQNRMFGSNFGQWSTEGALSNLLSKIGFNERWSSILSGSTAVARLIGMGAQNTTGQGVTGTVKAGEVQAQAFRDWTQRGGFFRSDRSGTDYAALDKDMSGVLNQGAKAVMDSVKAWGDALGLPSAALRDVTTQLRVTLTDDGKQNTEAMTAAFAVYKQDLLKTYEGTLEPFKKAGESVEQTISRLSALQAFSADLSTFGGVFSRLANLSISAKEELIGFAGGMQSLIEKTRGFVANYYSEAEQQGLVARQLSKQFADLGIDVSTLRSRADLRSLIEAQKGDTTESRRQLADLLAISGSFAGVAKYLEDSAQGENATVMSLTDLAKLAPAQEALNGLLSAGANAQTRTADGVSAVNDAVAAMSEHLSDGLNQVRDSVESGQAAIAESAQQTLRLFQQWDSGGAMTVVIDTSPGG